ncbi:MAG: ABC transporter permease [Eubacteriales bacterium]|nr:ABC transporter permease [Eubacteriales bacterium]
MATRTDSVGELVEGVTVRQQFTAAGDRIRSLSVILGTYGRKNNVPLHLRMVRENGEVAYEDDVSIADAKDNTNYTIRLRSMVECTPGETLFLEITSPEAQSGNAVTLWYDKNTQREPLLVNGQEVTGTLCFTRNEAVPAPFTRWFFISAAIVGAALFLTGLGLCLAVGHREGRLMRDLGALRKYKFLLSQLVGRDFKTKYRRSYLGVLWSILNPLLMMLVVSAVFSYVFRFNIEKFPVYLILGQTFFNVLSESTTIAMGSIIGSGQLIKKVYVPKYIFPAEKVMFSFVNFAISFVAIAIVMIYFKVPLSASMICLPLVLIYLFLFCMGVGLFLSALAVFFRDTLHLYNVLLTAWSYLTPIFYPVDSLNSTMLKLMNLNPMYHYIQYFRNIMMYGTFPTIQENWICLGFSIAALALGMWFFRRRQDRFILYI